jgi:hypothetical protein
LVVLLAVPFLVRTTRLVVLHNHNPNPGPLEFSEWPHPPVEVLLKQGAEPGLWSPVLGVRELRTSADQLLDARFPPLAQKLAATAEWLRVEVEGASDEALSRLAILRGTLCELEVLSGTFSQQGLEDLSRLSRLEELRLAGLPVCDEALAPLGNLPSLRTLDLSDTPVTDRGISHLRDLPALEHLLVYRTALTDASLDDLKALPRLRILEFTGSGITFPRFRQALPAVALG